MKRSTFLKSLIALPAVPLVAGTGDTTHVKPQKDSAGEDGYVMVWNNGTGRYCYVKPEIRADGSELLRIINDVEMKRKLNLHA